MNRAKLESEIQNLRVFGGILVVIWLICCFAAIWIEPFRIQFAISALFSFIVALWTAWTVDGKKDELKESDP